MRGRGLKPLTVPKARALKASPAVRGRGLKLVFYAAAVQWIKSPAVRGRGLKHRGPPAHIQPQRVARRARAWVETAQRGGGRKRAQAVARRARAWVETR